MGPSRLLLLELSTLGCLSLLGIVRLGFTAVWFLVRRLVIALSFVAPSHMLNVSLIVAGEEDDHSCDICNLIKSADDDDYDDTILTSRLSNWRFNSADLRHFRPVVVVSSCQHHPIAPLAAISNIIMPFVAAPVVVVVIIYIIISVIIIIGWFEPFKTGPCVLVRSKKLFP